MTIFIIIHGDEEWIFSRTDFNSCSSLGCTIWKCWSKGRLKERNTGHWVALERTLLRLSTYCSWVSSDDGRILVVRGRGF